MTENRPNCQTKETVCIDTYRVLDSCRDKDCFEDARVFLTPNGQNIVDRSSAVRVRNAKIINAQIAMDTVPFNRGFYQLLIKLFARLDLECCLGAGNTEDTAGVSVLEKKVILFGSEGNVSVFKNDNGCSDFCPTCGSHKCSASTNMPIAVIETVDPIILSTKIAPPNSCNCDGRERYDIPDSICEAFGDRFCDSDDSNKLLVSMGLFSVVRIERPAQYLVTASEYNVPSKECCTPVDDDPCTLFSSMSFPTSEFSPPSVSNIGDSYFKPDTSCPCSNK